MLKFSSNDISVADKTSSIIGPDAVILLKDHSLYSSFRDVSISLMDQKITSIRVSKNNVRLDATFAGEYTLSIDRISDPKTGNPAVNCVLTYSTQYPNEPGNNFMVFNSGIKGSRPDNAILAIENKCTALFTLFPDRNTQMPEKQQFTKNLIQNIDEQFNSILMKARNKTQEIDTLMLITCDMLEGFDIAMADALTRAQSQQTNKVKL